MQTSREMNIILAGRQVPILTGPQVEIGSIVTGIAAQAVWQVVARDGDRLDIIKLPRPVQEICTGPHAFAPYGRGQVCSRCTLRRLNVSEFLPTAADKPRAHIIVPNGELRPVMPYTLYGYMVGDALQTVYMNGPNWSMNMALIPALEVLWTIPNELQSLAGTAPPSEPAEND